MTTRSEGEMPETDIYDEHWNAHTHPEIEDQGLHVHAPDADWSVSFGMPMVLRHDDDLDIIGLMEFRGVAMNMRAAMEAQKEQTDLQEMTLAERQFTIIAYNADVMMIDSLLAVVDQGLVQHGVNPPCQLQTVDSSNIRSFGFVVIQAPDEPVPVSGVLYVAFSGGTLYRYEGVPIDTAQAFVEAPSKGTFFGAYIKTVGYNYTKVV